jgi:hypothetical protein
VQTRALNRSPDKGKFAEGKGQNQFFVLYSALSGRVFACVHVSQGVALRWDIQGFHPFS